MTWHHVLVIVFAIGAVAFCGTQQSCHDVMPQLATLASGACFRFNPIAGLLIPIIITCTGTWFASSLTTHNIHGSNGTGHKVVFRGCTSINAGGYGLRGDTGCDATTFANTDCNFGPPFANTSGSTSYV